MKDSGQLTFRTMGGETVVVPVRGKHYVKANGYAAPPGTGPAGETCGSCEHISHGRRWAKCDLTRACHTGGRRTDVLTRSPACNKWEKPK